ncbi:unnamed protein product, partial [Rotaria sp. Silwood2]
LLSAAWETFHGNGIVKDFQQDGKLDEL